MQKAHLSVSVHTTHFATAMPRVSSNFALCPDTRLNTTSPASRYGEQFYVTLKTQPHNSVESMEINKNFAA